MEVALVTIGRLENQYAIEFVEYYLKLGFNHIYIGDNNHGDEEHFEEVLQSYIDKKLVTIINVRDQISIQHRFYKEMYEFLQHKYDWLAFYDFDEFLTLNKHKTIQEYLNEPIFNNFNQILINWRLYTDNGLIHNDGRPCLERFTKSMKEDKQISYNFPQNNHVKSFIRGKINLGEVFLDNPHQFNNIKLNNTTCNSKGYQIANCPFTQYDFELAYIKHFTTKTIEEYLNIKYQRGTADRSFELFKKYWNIDSFFLYNEKTPEKLAFIENYLHKLN